MLGLILRAGERRMRRPIAVWAWADSRPDKVTPRSGADLTVRWRTELSALGYHDPDRPVQLRPTPIADQQCDSGGQSPTRTAAGYDDPLRVDPQLLGVLNRPHQTRVTVLHRPGVWSLRSQAIVHRHHCHTQLLGPVQHLG